MNEKVKQIFEILGVEPGEEFKINLSSSFYKLNIDLKVLVTADKERWYLSDFSIGDIIKYGIIKIPQKSKLTNKDKVAIKFLKNCGFHYVARDENTELYAYSNKPHRESSDGSYEWVLTGGFCTKLDLSMQNNIFSLIPWKDDGQESLFCLDNFSAEDLKED